MDSGDVRSSFWTLLLSATTLDAAVAVARAEAAGNPAREAELIAAWRSHAALAADAENRMDARLCGLEALQAFGRALGEARSVEDLMRAAARSGPRGSPRPGASGAGSTSCGSPSSRPPR